MFRLLIIAEGCDRVRDLSLGLSDKGFQCSIISVGDDILNPTTAKSIDLVVVAVDGAVPGSSIRTLPKTLKERTRLPVMALLSDDSLDVLDSGADVDDFVMEPWKATEVSTRLRRILRRTHDEDDDRNLIRCGDVAIDLARCEVVYRGRLVQLTFKEYELLKFLVTNKGRVFSREVLLNSVWGYDYFGGDRTVDVHVRRLRSKLDESDCIETVRNIGYRFKSAPDVHGAYSQSARETDGKGNHQRKSEGTQGHGYL
jgi:DNA-binding response OmpR family regulator